MYCGYILFVNRSDEYFNEIPFLLSRSHQHLHWLFRVYHAANSSFTDGVGQRQFECPPSSTICVEAVAHIF